MDIFVIFSLLKEINQTPNAGNIANLSTCKHEIRENISLNRIAISDVCFEFLKKEKTAFVVDDNNLVILGYEDLLIFKEKNNEDTVGSKIKILTGKNTKLKNVEALYLAKDKPYVFIKNKDENKLLAFNRTDDGNTNPVTTIEIFPYVNVNKIDVSFDDRKIVVLFENGKSKSYSFKENGR